MFHFDTVHTLHTYVLKKVAHQLITHCWYSFGIVRDPRSQARYLLRKKSKQEKRTEYLT